MVASKLFEASTLMEISPEVRLHMTVFFLVLYRFGLLLSAR